MGARTARLMRVSGTLVVAMAAGAGASCPPALARGGGHAADPLQVRNRLLSVPGPPASMPWQLGAPTSPVGTGLGGMAANAATGVALMGVGAWVLGAATFVLKQTAHILGQTTAPRLDSTWFSNAYWRVAAIASVLTLPFLFAAAVQALIRSDLTLLVRAAAGYLPIAMLIVAIAAPLTMLLLSASDQLAGVVSSAAGHDGAGFLARLAVPLGGLSLTSGSPFLAFLMALFIVAGALMLWIELLIRQAGVYVIVLMLPVAFAAFVWPARRIWAIRSVELLVALILSKFVIVAVLSLAGAALGHSMTDGLTAALSGAVLLILGACAPWALLRLIPLAELASSAAGSLRASAGSGAAALQRVDNWMGSEKDRWATRTAAMRRSAEAAQPPPVTSHDASGPAAAPAPAPESPEPEATRSATTPPVGDETPDGHAPKPDAHWLMTGEVFAHVAAPPIEASGESDP